jgi:cytochrome c biogenesis protein CcmG/thiol:disulfide interchange protein DsbE
MMTRFWPLIIFGILLIFLGIGLTLNARLVPSPLIDKPLPAFTLPTLAESQEELSTTALQGKVFLLNVWATWCNGCYQEHPLLNALAAEGIAIYGLNYKDDPAAARAWLTRLGNPYQAVFVDEKGDVGIDLGVYGAPETFVVDKKGNIRHKVIGILTEETLNQTVRPLLAVLAGES